MLEVDNANCVLVEFVNEYNKLAVGYRIWFVEKNLIENDDHLDYKRRNYNTNLMAKLRCEECKFDEKNY